MSEGFLISPENFPAYLCQKRLLDPESDIQIKEPEGGVSNIVLLVEGDGLR